jgi:tRNA uridine 5-carbamoylmethylation protein Kti12
MKLVILYGPPSVGKLTVAKQLAKITGFKIFHNQLTVDLVLELLPSNDKEFWKISSQIRRILLKRAAESNKVKGIIFTYCYAEKEDDKSVKKLMKTLKPYNTKFHFVNLITNKEILYKRVKEESRKAHKKIRTIKGLKSCLNKYELFKPIPFVESLTIDNTKLSAKKSAELIKKHYKF